MGFRHNPEMLIGKVLQNEATSRTDSANVTSTVYHGKVVDIDDTGNSNKIKVKIKGVDDLLKDENLPWAISSIPYFFYYQPQVGEHVYIFMANPWAKYSTRLWFGPTQTGNNLEESYNDVVSNLGFPELIIEENT